jgi:FlaA1/EpsC-like NDP-sugar epimerase
MNQICYEKNYLFMFERDESNINKITIDDLDGIKTIRLFLNDIEDKNLLNMLNEKLKELQ